MADAPLSPSNPAPDSSQARRLGLALSLVLVAFAFYRASAAPLHPLDTWDQWAYGRWIWEHHRLPEHEPFTVYSDRGPTPAYTCWLSQVGGYLLYSAGGMEAVALAYGAVEAVKWLLLLLACRRAAGSLLLGAVGAALLYAGRWNYFGVFRPQAVAEVGWAVLLVAAAGPPWPRWAVAAVPLAVLLWANTHPSFVLAFVVLGVLLLCRAAQAAGPRLRVAAALEDPDVRRLALTLALSLAAACCNPYGPRYLADVVRFGQLPVLQLIKEWGPFALTLSPNNVNAWAFVASAVVALATARLSPRRFTPAEAALLLLFGIGTWFAQRLFPFWMTACVVALLPHWRAMLDRAAGLARAAARPRLGAAVLAAGAAAAAALLALSPSARWLASGRPRPARDQFREQTPVVVARDLAAAGDRAPARILCSFKWSDYLLYELPGGDQLYWYTHLHCFTPRHVDEGQRVLDLHGNLFDDERALGRRPDWRAVLDHSRIDVVALYNERRDQPDEKQPLFDYLLAEQKKKDSEWDVTVYTCDLRDGAGGGPRETPTGLVARRRRDPFVEGLVGASAAQGCVGGGLSPPASGWSFLAGLPWVPPDS
jgi:hypothetical protein